MRYALTFIREDGYGSAWDGVDTIIVETDMKTEDWYHSDGSFVKQILHDYGLTDEEIEGVLEDRFFVRNVDDVDIKA